MIFHILSFVNALFLVSSYLIRKLCEKKKLNFFCTLLLYIKNKSLYLDNDKTITTKKNKNYENFRQNINSNGNQKFKH